MLRKLVGRNIYQYIILKSAQLFELSAFFIIITSEMFTTIKAYINTPYPFYYYFKEAFLIGIIIFALGTSFSVLFEPFDVNFSELKFNYFIVSIIHSLVSFVVFLCSATILSSIIVDNTKWRIKHEMLFLGIVLLLIGIFQFLIRDFIYDKTDNWSYRYLYEEIRNTFFIGMLFVFIITSLNVERLKELYSKRSIRINNIIADKSASSSSIFIVTKVKSDDFNLELSNLLFVKSDKNYVQFYLKDGSVLLKRMSLSSVLQQLSDVNFMIQTHRSYIVNLTEIISVKGNAQGYQLTLQHSDYLVPVSRSMIDLFEKAIQG